MAPPTSFSIATTTATLSPLVQQTAGFVKSQLQSNDASHDWRHIERVWTLARTLAKEEVGHATMLSANFTALTVLFLYTEPERRVPRDCGSCCATP
jgi:hypothetical protein